MGELSIGLVGCGHWGRYILRDLVALGVRVAVVARSEESRANAAEFGAHEIVPDLESLPTLDGAVVAVRTPVAFEILRDLGRLGIPVFTEKPLTASLAEAEALAPMADRIFMMDKWRYHPGIVKLGEMARAGDLGEIQKIHCVRWGWRSKPREIDAVWYLSPHDLAITLEILGGIPSLTAASFEYFEGVASGGTMLLGSRPWVEISVSERRVKNERIVRVHGERAMAVLPGSYSEAIEIYPLTHDYTPPEPERLPVSSAMPLELELAAFVGYLRGGPAPKSNYACGRSVVEIIEKAHALAQSS